MTINASEYVIDGVLIKNKVNDLHLVAFMSGASKLTERWYSAYDTKIVTDSYSIIHWRSHWERFQEGS